MKNYSGKQNKSSATSAIGKNCIPQFQGGSLEQYMQILYTHQKQCQKTGKYMEAELAKKKLSQMKIQLQKNRKGQMVTKHSEERRQVEMAHVEQITEFNSYWDQKMTEYQQEAEKLQNQTMERHQNQAYEFQQQIERSLGYNPKQSSQIINLRKIQQNLAKQENYIQAHTVQKQIEVLQKSQYEKWNYVRVNKIRNLLQQLRNKQDTELSALRQKIQQGFQQQKKIRNHQCDKLIQKYQNFMKELQNNHHQETIKLDKASKLKSTMNFSRTSAMSNMSRALQPRN